MLFLPFVIVGAAAANSPFVFPLSLDDISNDVLNDPRQSHQLTFDSMFDDAGTYRYYSLDLAKFCSRENICYTHHWTLFVRVIPSGRSDFFVVCLFVGFVCLCGGVSKQNSNDWRCNVDSAFIPYETQIVHFATSLDSDAAPVGFSYGRVAQIAPYDLEPRVYYVVVRTPSMDDARTTSAEWLKEQPYQLAITLGSFVVRCLRFI